MKPEIEKLVEKWIEEEQGMRNTAELYGYVKDRNRSKNLRSKADLLQRKRRELQEAAGLVVVP